MCYSCLRPTLMHLMTYLMLKKRTILPLQSFLSKPIALPQRAQVHCILTGRVLSGHSHLKHRARLPKNPDQNRGDFWGILTFKLHTNAVLKCTYLSFANDEEGVSPGSLSDYIISILIMCLNTKYRKEQMA